MPKKNIKKVLAFCFFSFIIINLFPQEEIEKKYFNNIFGGGKEKILTEKNSKIEIDSLNLDINLFVDYAEINATYKVKNYGENSNIVFCFPKLDAKVRFVEENNKTSDKIIKGDYENFSVLVDKNQIKYSLKEDSEKEFLMLPYKIGSNYEFYDLRTKKKKTIQVDSYKFYYSWYTFPFDLKKKESKTITISYETPLYYNQIIAKNIKQDFLNLEDAALNYIYHEEGDTKLFESEKIFSYLLSSPYLEKAIKINKIFIHLNANIIDLEFLKVLPINFKKSGNDYTWKYKNLNPKEMNNILVSVSPNNSKKNSKVVSFKAYPEKKVYGNKSFYEINKNNDELILELKKDNNDKTLIKNIKITPDYINNNSDLKKLNLPLDLEISFSKDKNFTFSKTIKSELKPRRMFRELNKNSSIEIFNSKNGIEAKFIKIKFLNTTKKNEKLIISNILIVE